jgi:DNA recombination protein RmuC
MMDSFTSLDPGMQQVFLVTFGFVAGCVLTALIAWGLSGGRASRLEQQLAVLSAELEAEKRIAEQREQAFAEAREQLEASFSLLSGDALRRNSENFLKLAEERFKAQQANAHSSLGEREKAIETLVKPIKDALQKTEQQIQEMEKDRKQTFGALEKHLVMMGQDQEALRSETRNLVKALRRPEVRGRWGEMTLRRLVELVGMVDHCDFTEQVQVDGEDGRFRPDMVIRLPDEREIVVDVKTPLDAYLTAQEAGDDETRETAMAQHVRNVRGRVKELADKAYWEQFSNSPDFVVLFIPGEQFLAAALDRDPVLLEDALRAKVILATPTSFVALLRAVAFSWRQVDVIRNAEEIRSLAEEFYKRVATFSEHFHQVGKALSRSVDHYNRTVGSLERQVLPSALRLKELGVSSRKEIVEPERLEQQVRTEDDG